MAIDTNPVQQRIEYLADLWNDIPKKKVKMICTQVEDDDEEMIDTFYNYMLGLNNSIIDIEIILETPFVDSETYSNSLITELSEVIELWNKAEFKDPTFEKINIDWKPNYSINDKNESKLFIDNINSLAECLDLQKGRFLVINLYIPYLEEKKLIVKWFSELLSLKFHPQVKVLVTQTRSNKIYNDLLFKYSDLIYLWEPNIDTPNVISKVAAMGDPSSPDTQYRLSLAELMKAVGCNDYDKTNKSGKECLEIAYKNIDTDPYWLAQVVTVNIILSNEDVKNKEKKKALKHAGDAIKIGELAPKVLSDQIGFSILAQAQMNKALILCHDKKWMEAAYIYEVASENLVKSRINVAAIESSRMAAYCYRKAGESMKALDNLCKGFEISEDTDSESLKRSTYCLLLVQILKSNIHSKIPEKRLDAKACSVYGADWQEVVQTIWKHPEDESDIENPFIVNIDNKE